MRRAHRKKRGWRRWVLLLAVILGWLIFLDSRAAEWLLTYGEHQAQGVAAETVTEAVAAALGAEGTTVTVLERDEAGNVTSLQTDTAAISRLQATVTEALSAIFEAEPTASFSVSIGTLFGSAWMSGRGPKQTFCYQWDGHLMATPRETFSSAGINQVCHTVYLDVQIQLLLTAAGRQKTVTVTVPAVVSQTVLVGTVPDTYVDVNRLNG